jgi:hydrogenase maturation protease
MHALALKLDLPAPSSYEDPFPSNALLDFGYYLQLTPELAEEISTYRRVCFVDAHTGNVPALIQMVPLTAQFQHSPFTHHLTPQSLLAMCQALYKHEPESVLLSVRGYRFEFERRLSEETAELVPQALDLLLEWL